MSLQVLNCGSNDTQDGYISPPLIFSESICLHFANSALLKKNETGTDPRSNLIVPQRKRIYYLNYQEMQQHRFKRFESALLYL